MARRAALATAALVLGPACGCTIASRVKPRMPTSECTQETSTRTDVRQGKRTRAHTDGVVQERSAMSARPRESGVALNMRPVGEQRGRLNIDEDEDNEDLETVARTRSAGA